MKLALCILVALVVLFIVLFVVVLPQQLQQQHECGPNGCRVSNSTVIHQTGGDTNG